MFNKVLLINAEYPTSHYEFLSMHTGLGYISECLDKAGIENDVYEPAVSGGYKNLRKKISSFKPDLIGYSMMSFSYRYNYEIMSRIKSEFSCVTIVAGGPHISTFGRKALIECQAIDVGVAMEGEETLVEICKGRPMEDLCGIIFRDKKGDAIETKQRDLIEDLDRVPFPKYKKFDISSYPKIIPIVTSRGCPHQCIFCPIASVMGPRFRARSPSNVADEIEYWYGRGFKDFSIADDVFNFDKKRVYDICDEIEKRHLSGLRIRCSNGIRADKVDREILLRMKDVGFYCLAFGVESGNDKILKTLKKGETVETIEKAIDAACKLGYWVELFFLIGSPGETWSNVEESIKLALKYPIYDARFYNLIPFPQTELYKWVEEKNYFLFPHPEYLNDIMHHVNKPIFATPELKLKIRKKAYKYANGIIKRHTKAKKYAFDIWLTKEKLSDYYGITGFFADIIAWLYCHRWSGKIIRFLHGMLKKSQGHKTHDTGAQEHKDTGVQESPQSTVHRRMTQE